jgi:short-subunit dehydrogenase
MSEPVTVITGASGGIGEALAYCAARAGRKLVLVARSADKMKTVADKIVSLGGKQPEIVALDLGDPKSGEQLAGALKAKNFKVAELINNAGYGLTGPVEKLDAADQVGIVDLNIRALTDLTLRFLPEILEAKGGVLNVASTAAFLPGPNMAIYYASKAYVLSFSEAIWFELKGRARVTALCPGPVPTGFQDRATRGKGLFLARLSITSADYVAAKGWRAFERGKRVVIPGMLYQLVLWSAYVTPRPLLLWFSRQFAH